MKAMLKEANKQFNSSWAEKVTIKYDLMKAGETNSNWTIGDTFQYEDVPCLREIITQATFADSSTANVVISKGNFYIPWDGYDFRENKKRNIKIIIDDQTISIDKVISLVPLINKRWIYWALIQK
jgi:hypothetical protein